MKKNVVLSFLGIILSGFIYSQTTNTANSIPPGEGEEIRTEDVVFKSQEQKDAKIFQVQERIKLLEGRKKDAQNEVERKKFQSQLERCYKRLEMLNNTKVVEPIPGRRVKGNE